MDKPFFYQITCTSKILNVFSSFLTNINRLKKINHGLTLNDNEFNVQFENYTLKTQQQQQQNQTKK